MSPTASVQTEVIYREDNLYCLRELPDECVDLIYLDPPFFSNRSYEVIWGDEAEVRSFEDRWKGGIKEYVDWMRQRIAEMHRVLKPSGSLFLHCDPTASHYLKVALDEAFGVEQFRNEIIWKRSGVKGDAKRRLGAAHDVLLGYAKTSEASWTAPIGPPTPEYLARFGRDDQDGRGPYNSAPLDSPQPRPNLTYEYKGVAPPSNGWRVRREEMERLDADRRLIFPARPGGKIRRKLYLRDRPGPPLGDVWTDIFPLNSQAAERLGYPTQKPEALLARILEMASERGDIVLDPFCGCGTSIAVAQQLQRRWIGIDISPQAATIMKRRVDGYGANATVVGLPATIDDLKQLGPFEFQNWVIQIVNGVHRSRKTGDLGIDGYTFLDRMPIQVKQSERVGRNVVDNFETAIDRDHKPGGFVVAFSFTRGAYDEAARTREIGKTPVQLVRVSDLLALHDIVLAAEAARTQPDLSHIGDDLMPLFMGVIEARRRPHSSRPVVSMSRLVESADQQRAEA